MSKPILCLDFDGTVYSYRSGWLGATKLPDPPTDGAIEFMLDALQAGWDVVIHSSRARHWGGIRAMRTWLYREAGMLWYEDGFGPGLENVRFVRWKPPAMVSIDDRTLTFEGNWKAFDLAQLRQFKPWNKRTVQDPPAPGDALPPSAPRR